MVKIDLFNHLTLQNSAPRYKVLPHVKLMCFVIYRHGFHGNVLQEGIQPSAFIVATEDFNCPNDHHKTTLNPPCFLEKNTHIFLHLLLKITINSHSKNHPNRGGFQQVMVPKNSPLMDFLWNKPSSELGGTMTMEPPIVADTMKSTGAIACESSISTASQPSLTCLERSFSMNSLMVGGNPLENGRLVGWSLVIMEIDSC